MIVIPLSLASHRTATATFGDHRAATPLAVVATNHYATAIHDGHHPIIATAILTAITNRDSWSCVPLYVDPCIADVKAEIEPEGYEFVKSVETLPWQHMIFFKRAPGN